MASYAALTIPEIITIIFKNLHWKSIPVVRQVCSQWYNIVNNNENLKYKFKYYSEFGGPLYIIDEEDYDEEELEKRKNYLEMDWKGKYNALLAEIEEMKDYEHYQYRQNYWFTEWALQEGHYKFLEKLILEDKYNIEFYEGDPILSECLRKNDIKTFKILMKYDKKNKSELFPPLRHSSLQHEAARLGNLKFLKLLLDAGVDIDHYEDGEGTPILVALNENSEEIVLLFLERGADLENVFEAYSFEELIEHCATKLWARSIIAFMEKECKQREDGLMFAGSEVESIKEDQRELVQYITDAIETMKNQEQTNEAAANAIQLLENYSKELETKFNEMINELNTQHISTNK